MDIPPVPGQDPASAVLADPQVAESKRFCPRCEHPVGRAREGRPGLTEGFCRNCGTPFSFTPKLRPGDLVGGQYEVLGCLAHGGLGWIYLAKDRNVSDSWRVLKGLLNTGDADAMAAAVAERRFLAEVDHPNIVRIYNFVQHQDPRSGETAGYIVMEYVGGRSLRQILLDERKAGRSIPVEHALAYAIEVLRAFGYLHSRGLVYCDFKPDNVLQSEEMLKLIDMGGVRRIDDQDSPIYGTVGYQAPEIATDGPSPSSDLYTIGRALAVLTFEFTGYTSTYEHSLPGRRERRCWPSRSRSTGCCAGPPVPTPAAASNPPPTWPSSSPGSCARFWPSATAFHGLPSPRCSALSYRRPAPRPQRTAGPGPARTPRPWPRLRQLSRSPPRCLSLR